MDKLQCELIEGFYLSLRLTTKESDEVVCEYCNKGVFVPKCPDSNINHSFTCNHCGVMVHIDADIIVE